ncbi:MAG: Serine/threonine protein kinase SRPK1 [Monoraphidium minutum]|nr:MAG: Serine/threonine protein kinase SRPK1 [Monoraphidium minutum]
MNRPGPGPRAVNRFANKKLTRKPGTAGTRGGPGGKGASQQQRGHSTDTGSGDESDGGDFSGSDVEDAEDYCKGGYHPVQVGEKFKGGRYVVLRKLGWGHFSTVWLVLDTHTDGFAALKVQKSAPHYTDAARDEVTLLGQLSAGDASGASHCVRLLDNFEHAGPHGLHVCLVFEVLGDNLLALIKAYDYRGLPLPIVRNIGRQVLAALDFMHGRCGILHTDLKPENIMLTDTLAPRRWEMELPPVPPPAPARPAGGGGGAQQQQQQQQQGSGDGGGGGLTKNQKKKAKRKQAKAAAGSGGAEGSEATASEAAGGGGDEGEGEGEVEQAAPPGAERQENGGAAHAAAAAGGEAQQQGAAAAAGGGAQPQAEGQQRDGGDEGQAAPRRRRLVYESRVLRSSADMAGARAKVVDFGNACWLDKRFTDDVQTRQYRCPEVILGAKWGAPADVWSVACLVFELATGDYLFEPKSGPSWDRDEDHLALMIELLGRMPRRVWSTGRNARDYFNRQGELRHIRKLKPWGLREVLADKYRFTAKEAADLADFLLPMLRLVPEERATAAEMLRHPWLSGGGGERNGGGEGGGGEPRRSSGGGARRSSSGGERGSSSGGSGGRASRSPRRRAGSEPAAKRSRPCGPATLPRAPETRAHALRPAAAAAPCRSPSPRR